MKRSYLILLLVIFSSCQENIQEKPKTAEPEKKELAFENNTNEAELPDTIEHKLTVMVIPCSNGYEYNMHMGDLNPSLEKYLDQDDRIIRKPFPLKEMRGSGYFGVFDKRHCGKILEKVNVDFLIMTRMKGIILQQNDSDSSNWGYETKFLNVHTMQQFKGIQASNLKSFELIDTDLKNKTNQLINLMIDSHNE